LAAAEVASAEARHLRTELVFVAAPLSAAVLVARLTELAALVPAPATTAAIVPVPVVVPVSARRFGLVLTQANRAEEPQR
jgi:hypothetical protein